MDIIKRNFGVFVVLLISCCLFGITRSNCHFILYLLIPIGCLAYFSVWHATFEFKKPIFLFFILLMVSAVACRYFREQKIMDTLTTQYYLNFYAIGSYFFLLKKNICISEIEKLLRWFYIVFLVIYIIQYIAYPTPIVQILVQNLEQHRFRLAGQIINSLGLLYCYNRYLLYKGKKDLLLAGLGLLVVFMLGFRAMLLSILFVMLLMYIRINRISFVSISKLLVGGLVAGVILFQIPAVKFAVNRMIEAQNSGQTYENEDYMRIIQLDYFMNVHFENNIERLTGSGIPSHKSLYGDLMHVDTQENYRDTAYRGWVDWGMLGLSWMIGPFAVLCLLYIYGKGAWIAYKSSEDYIYISAWFVFLLMISFNNIESFRLGGYGFQMAVLYIVHKLKLGEIE